MFRATAFFFYYFFTFPARLVGEGKKRCTS